MAEMATETAKTADEAFLKAFAGDDEGLSEAELSARRVVLDALVVTLRSSRSESIDKREQSGIEDEWIEDEEHYQGIDDRNRAEMKAWRDKEIGEAPISTENDTGSRIFVNITRPYVDAGAARVGDMLLPTDDRGWSINATPVPEMIALSKHEMPRRFDQQLKDQVAGGQMTQEQADQQKAGMFEQAASQVDEANERARLAEEQINDWHVESGYNAQARQVIEDAAKSGTGILKGPVPVKRKRVAWKDGRLHIEEKTQPASHRVNFWNCYPDMGCGESIHDGGFHWERDDITSKALRQLIGNRGYLDDQIREVLEEGPCKATKEKQNGPDDRADLFGLTKRDTSNLYEIWYYYGQLTRDECEAAGMECPDEESHYDVVVTMVNNRVIKANMQLLDTGELPYDYMVWQRRPGMPWGTGIARQIRTPQRMVNGAARNMMDNAGLAGGPMWMVNPHICQPIDGVMGIAPRKGWVLSDDADLEHLESAFSFIEMPMRQEELERIILLAQKLAEDVSGLPMILQGQQGSASDTYGGMQMLQNNASSVLRRIARLYDDLVNTPHVRRYYTYLLQWGEDDRAKGEFVVEARGSSALVERDLHNQIIKDMGQLVLDPRFGKDPAKWFDEFLKSQRLDPARFSYDDDKWREVVEGLAQQAQAGDSRVEVAQIAAQSRVQVKQLDVQSEGEDRQLKVALEAMRKQEADEKQQTLMALKAVEQHWKELDIASAHKMHDDDMKQKLAEVIMKLQAQVQLSQDKSGDTQPAPQVATPIAEPPGRAPDGKAFQE